MPNVGAPELIIILVIVLLLFGARKLPDLASSMGKSIREFRKAADERPSPDESGRDQGDETPETERAKRTQG